MATTRRDEPGAVIDLFVREVRDDDRDRTTLSAEYRRYPSLDEQERQIARQARRQFPRRRRARS